MFLSFAVSFLSYTFKKISFSGEKTPAFLRETFVEKLLQFNVAKHQMKILLLAELGALKNYTTIADRDVPLTGKNLRYFQFAFRSTCPYVVR